MTRIQPRELRCLSGRTQQMFWQQVHVTQSGGSRYESGRDMPASVIELLRLHYVLGIDTRQINASNAEQIRAVLENGTAGRA